MAPEVGWGHLSGRLHKSLPSVCSAVYLTPRRCLSVALKHNIGNEYTSNNRRIVGRVVFYAVRVLLRKIRRLVLPRTSYFLEHFPNSSDYVLPSKEEVMFHAAFLSHWQGRSLIRAVDDVYKVRKLWRRRRDWQRRREATAAENEYHVRFLRPRAGRTDKWTRNCTPLRSDNQTPC
jgi:hypothetical protein